MQLLDRDPTTRLGAGSDDSKEIMAHPFFEGMDWTALKERKIKAQYIPPIKTDSDSYNADDDNQQVQSDIKA